LADINSIIRDLIVEGLGQIPDAGWLISSIVGELWPQSGEDIWSEIESDVEALIGQQLSAFESAQVQQDLQGLQNVMSDYQSALANSASDPAVISENWVAAQDQFDVMRPHFMAAGYEVLLLPLLAQMANLHLSLLRDGVTAGAKWGWPETEVAAQEAQLKTMISTYTSWVSTWYQNGLNALSGGSWQQQNTYIRQMTLGATDFAFYWSSFDPETNPGGGTIAPPVREIYSDPIAYEGDYPISVTPAPPQVMTQLTIFGRPFLTTIIVGGQVTWGNTVGPVMGFQDSYVTSNQPEGWTGAIAPSNPLVTFAGGAGPGGPDNGGWTSVTLTFKDGSTAQCGNPASPQSFSLSYDGHIVSNLMVMQGSPNLDFIVDGFVVGFRLENAY
jgi:hypothetical protein